MTNVSEDGGEDCINLSAARSFQARIPVSMTEEAAAQAAGKAEWSLLRDSGKAYLDPVLYPNQTAGGGPVRLGLLRRRDALFHQCGLLRRDGGRARCI